MIEQIRIGGVSVGVSDPEGLIPHVQEGMAPFAEVAGSADLVLSVEWGAPGHSPDPLPVVFESGGLWRLFDADGAYRFEFTSPSLGVEPYRVAEVDRSWTLCHAILRRELIGKGASALEYPLDEILVTGVLSRMGGIELHACGIELEGKGYLFVGHSGAGKSTTGLLWAERFGESSILSDDRVILRSDPEGGIRMWGTPWHGEARLSRPASVPLSKVFVIRQAPESHASLLRPASAVAALLSRSFIPLWDREAVDRSTEAVARVIAEVPVFDLAFTRDASAIEAALSC